MRGRLLGFALVSLAVGLHPRAGLAQEPPPSSPPPHGQPPPAYPYYPPPPGYPPPGYPPPGYGYPPPGYGYPPPGYGYPPPGYGYPPPGYPPPETAPKPAPPRVQLPEDLAARTTPFLDALVAVGGFEERFGHAFDIGVQAGTFIGARLRVAGRLIAFTSAPEDDVETFGSSEFAGTESDSPSVLYGGAVGLAAVSRPKFVVSPSVVFMRTDVRDYGSFVGIGVPFEWVMVKGPRIGFEIDVGRAFGGSVIERCQNLGIQQSCVPGEERRVERTAGTAIYLHFQIGWGLFRPET
jgi:hypothetical protein